MESLFGHELRLMKAEIPFHRSTKMARCWWDASQDARRASHVNVEGLLEQVLQGL